MNRQRIDTHTHVVPPRYLDWLSSQPDYRGALVDWNEAAALEAFEKKGIETGILSVSSPGVRFGPDNDAQQSRDLARYVNEFCADVVRKDSQHFGFFATVVLPDLEGSIEEARYALDDLHADGVTLFANTEGTYLGSPQLDPLLEMLNERGAAIFVHPTALPGPRVADISPGAVDFLADTSRAAASLVKHDCLIRYPDLRFILSHGGGYVPYAATRIACMIDRNADQDEVISELQKFYFDTAMIGGPYALPSLLAFADPSHITFGSDWPYEFRPDQSRHFTDRFDAFELTDVQRRSIDRGNAEALFPRLAKIER